MPSEVLSGNAIRSNESNSQAGGIGLSTANGTNNGGSNIRTSNGGDSVQTNRSSVSEGVDTKEFWPNPDGENGSRSENSDVLGSASQVLGSASQIEAERIEQYEPGVYITLVAVRDGTRDLKRVRFSRRRFGEHQAETWWSENREKVYERYNVRGTDKSSARISEQPLSPSSGI